MPGETYISKWGNSLAVRIPKEIAREARLGEGDRVTFGLAADGNVVLSPVRRRYGLHELVSRITSKNRHAETNWGAPVGREQ